MKKTFIILIITIILVILVFTLLFFLTKENEDNVFGEAIVGGYKAYTYHCQWVSFLPKCARTPTVCGNRVVDNYEQCDDGNGRRGDGCYRCKLE